MAIFVGNDEIKQIIIGPDIGIAKVYYGNKIVWETNALVESNVPLTKTIRLTPGVYEVIAVGGAGGSVAQGSGSSSPSEGNTAYPEGGT